LFLKVAAAVLDWALANGASSYCHWFQPLGASGLRHGQSAQVQIAMIEFDRNGKPEWDFKVDISFLASAGSVMFLSFPLSTSRVRTFSAEKLMDRPIRTAVCELRIEQERI
jgi:hypothetical protein